MQIKTKDAANAAKLYDEYRTPAIALNTSLLLIRIW